MSRKQNRLISVGPEPRGRPRHEQKPSVRRKCSLGTKHKGESHTTRERQVVARAIRRDTAKLIHSQEQIDWRFKTPRIWNGAAERFLAVAPNKPLFDLIITSPPYNIGKEYEEKEKLARYLRKQRRIIKQLVDHLKPGGSICWQVGNHISNGEIFPLDLKFHSIFKALNLRLRNRIIWHFGHGLHSRQRFSGRYEVILWYTKGDNYKFNLDAVRVESKYPGKKAYKGPRKGEYSSHPRGKNPSDVWDIPNVKGNHVEKTIHPCQFPVGLVARLVLALTNKNDLVFDPFCGVASAGVAAVQYKRRFVGCERLARYAKIGIARLNRAARGEEKFRHHNKPIFDHTKSKLSIRPMRVVRSKRLKVAR